MDLTCLDNRMKMFKDLLNHKGLDHKDYQYEGVNWCLNNELRNDPPFGVRGGFLADEMGLGKTIMMIGLMYCNFVPNTLIVVPPILLQQWYLQIYRNTGHKALIFHGPGKKKQDILKRLSSAPIVITTYGAITLTKSQIKKAQIEKELTYLMSPIHQIKWSRVIFDEAHHLRNSKTTRYISARMLDAKIRWLVSGTPIQNRKHDFYSLCALIRLPASFYTDINVLFEFARSFILKRTKKQVGIQITDISVTNSFVQWSCKAEMSLAEELHSLLGFSRVDPRRIKNKTIANAFGEMGVLTTMLRAKQFCIYPKMMTKHLDTLVNKGFLDNYSSYKSAFENSSKLDAVIQDILHNKDNKCGKLVFCHYREEINEIARRLKEGGIQKVAVLDGRVSSSKRNSILNEKNDVLILQIQTGCEGLNLQENYSEIYFVSPHWNPSVEDQAIARCHRIGQLNTVHVKRFEMCSFQDEDSRTIEGYVNDIQHVKRNIVNEMMTK